MRLLLPILLAVTPAAAAAQPAPPVAPAGIFLSPMGEPFRSADAAADIVGTWFGAADADRDGALVPAEFRRDAARFFALLDLDRDSEIEPGEMARYENEVAPEVQLGLQMRTTQVGGWRGGRQRRVQVFKAGLDGAGRYAFLNIPQPVIAADSDMNRGVTRGEFEQAADQRFVLLDKDRDGRLVRAELPPLPQPRYRRPEDDEASRRRFEKRR
ncbi:MAG TPA: hypothetical protein VF619_04330 [Allosphingosinicella sp.]|jgi:hypothetical protein